MAARFAGVSRQYRRSGCWRVINLILLLTTTMARLRTSARRDHAVKSCIAFIDAVGLWSMIDIFMESILVALVQFGAVVTVSPGPGAIAFAAVVILTMLASALVRSQADLGSRGTLAGAGCRSRRTSRRR